MKGGIGPHITGKLAGIAAIPIRASSEAKKEAVQPGPFHVDRS